MTKEEHENLLREIAETGGDTANMLELMQKLRDDFDEREGMLRKYDEERDKERPEGAEEEGEHIREESEEDNVEDNGERRNPLPEDMVPRADYEDLRRKYIERFFSSPEEAKEDQEEDVKRDGEEQSFESLFKEREG